MTTMKTYEYHVAENVRQYFCPDTSERFRRLASGVVYHLVKDLMVVGVLYHSIINHDSTVDICDMFQDLVTGCLDNHSSL